MRQFIWLMVLLLTWPVQAADLMGEGATMNEDGLSCVDVAKSKNSQTMKNICRERIYVMWCHDLSSMPGTKSSECGGGDHRYYTHNLLLDPGETRDNPYTMPLDAKLHYGVCVGGSSWDTRTLDESGNYICNIRETPGKDEILSEITVVGEGATETCSRAKGMAKDARYVGKCACRAWHRAPGDTTVCKLQVIVKDSEKGPSLMQLIQAKMRTSIEKDSISVKEIGSNPKDQKLFIRGQRTAGGIRG